MLPPGASGIHVVALGILKGNRGIEDPEDQETDVGLSNLIDSSHYDRTETMETFWTEVTQWCGDYQGVRRWRGRRR